MFSIAILVFLFVGISLAGWLAVGVTTRRTWIELCIVFVGTVGGMLVACLAFGSLSGLPPLADIAFAVAGGFAGGSHARKFAIRWQRSWWR